MILVWLIIWLGVGGIAAWVAGRWSKTWSRWIALVTVGINLAVAISLFVQYNGQISLSDRGPWLVEFRQPWVPQLGISFYLALDGLSLLMVLLVNFLGLIAVAASWAGIQDRVGFFHLNLLWVLAATSGVFLALDLFLFYFFWEMMLVPLYFLIGIWGHENRVYATLKFFLFTQAGSLLMLLSILALYFLHGRASGSYTYNYLELLGTEIPPATAMLLMLGFIAAFAVKLPLVPFHTWLPDAHTEAPTAGSVILAGLVLKTGAYGFFRFAVPLFPEAALRFTPAAMILGVVGILYGAVLAFAQTDLKRLVAYTSISHMGFVILGIFSWNQLAMQGAVMVMLAHGVSTGALFVLVGDLQDRMHTRDLGRMGGLWSVMPRMGGTALVFALASLGLPGLGNFVGEFLTLLGAYLVNVPLVVFATLGFVVATVYALWMIQRIFGGPNAEGWQLHDLNPREMAIMATMIIVILWLGLYPQPMLDVARPALQALRNYASDLQQAVEPVYGTATSWPLWIGEVLPWANLWHGGSL